LGLAPPRSELSSGEGDTAALKIYDERRCCGSGPAHPISDQRPSTGQDMP